MNSCTDSGAALANTEAVDAKWVTAMDNYQRKMLEIEIELHRARIAQLTESLRDMEENLSQVVDAPEELTTQADRLRLELKGRRAAYEVGSAHLRSLRAA